MPTGIPDEPTPQIGPYLRACRKHRGLSLHQVALATGISKSFLSLVENGTNDITFGRLHRLLTLYGVSLNDLLPAAVSETSVVVRRGDRERLYSPAEGMDVYLASPDTRRSLLAGVAVLGPGAVMKEDSTHDGEEWVHVVRGTVQLSLDGNDPTITLDAGDSVYLHAGRRHRFANVGDLDTEVITVLSQGNPRESSPRA